MSQIHKHIFDGWGNLNKVQKIFFSLLILPKAYKERVEIK